ncbi:hypothetical protein [Halorubrum sp. BV1]|uniref:DUF7471 family protein n=1 Tax=Halorubrum sp. BV1 TaxID=1498500 RepID=UPI00067938E5|nr:hypothetical protein [Halorubrum sp. BV1]
MSPIAASSTAGSWGVEGSLPLLVVVAVAGVGTGLLFLVSLLAYRRRRSLQYRLISLAVGALLARSVVGAGTVLGVVPMLVHHFVEHSLDFLVSAIVLYAVYAHAPGSVPETAETRSETDDPSDD